MDLIISWKIVHFFINCILKWEKSPAKKITPAKSMLWVSILSDGNIEIENFI